MEEVTSVASSVVLKVCRRCGQEKPVAEFSRGRAVCKPCRVSVQSEYQRTARGKLLQRGRHLRFRYDLELEDYEALLAAQGGVCAICGSDDARNPRSPDNRFSVDHDHVTSAVRGLLCLPCNSDLGWLEANREAIERYLARASQRADTSIESAPY